MEPSEPVPPSKTEAPISSTPGSRSRLKWPITDFVDDLRDLNVIELDNVRQFVQQIRATRGDRPSPELVSQIVAAEGVRAEPEVASPTPVVAEPVVKDPVPPRAERLPVDSFAAVDKPASPLR